MHEKEKRVSRGSRIAIEWVQAEEEGGTADVLFLLLTGTFVYTFVYVYNDATFGLWCDRIADNQ